MLFKNYIPSEIAKIINTIWLDPDYMIVVVNVESAEQPRQKNSYFVPFLEKARERRKRKQESRHHRRPKSLGGGGHSWNISVVEQEEHAAWHILFSNMTPEEIVAEINAVWLDRAFNFASRAKIAGAAGVVNGGAVLKGNTFIYRCFVCGEHHQSDKKAKRCKKRGFIAPRYAKGERVRVSIPKKKPEEGVIVDWHREDSANPHTYEFYMVKLDSGAVEGVFAYNMQIFTRGKWVKRSQVTKKSKQKRDRVLRKRGFKY
ncbi:MAG: hypothetical protein AAB378_02350 [Patescibacteria group bacterium]